MNARLLPLITALVASLLAATPAMLAVATGGPAIAEARPLRWLIPTSAYVACLAGTNWVSDIVLHNRVRRPRRSTPVASPAGRATGG